MDKYVLKVGLDYDSAELDKLSGKISDQLSSMGKVSDGFIDASIAKAREYKKILDDQNKIVKDIDRRLSKDNLSEASRRVLEGTKEKSLQTIKDYTYGNAEKGLDSKWVVDSMSDYAKANKSFGSKLNSAGTSLILGVSKIAAGFNAASMVIKGFISSVKKSLEDFSELSNKLNPLGAFGSSSQRGVMTRYGLTGSQALGFTQTLSAMGMGESDIGMMTNEQRRVFNSLQNFWNEGMSKLDPDALDRYTESMSKLQEIQAKYDMGLQQTILKLVSGSPKFNEFVGEVGNLLDATLEFFQSPVVEAVFDGLIDFLTTVVTILEKGMRLVNKLFGGGAGTTTNNTTTNNVSSNYNIYGSDYRSNEELARQISYSNSGNYGG